MKQVTAKETYNSLKQEVLSINEALSSLLITVLDRQDIEDIRFKDWHKACADIHQQIADEVVRVAVIGTVKSGKSTLVNSLFNGDYVKRGAGVVTSIVTRIRRGDGLKAVLFFKSWDDVNADIEQALFMLPTWKKRADDRPFDIRREKDRRALNTALAGLSEDLLITEGVRNTNIVLLSLYLKGYDLVRDKISADSMTSVFSDDQFAEHRTFVGDDTLAVYLKDIELEISDDTIDRSIEIADCQGSDSPNPLHLAMIQDYLLRTHFIVYVVSSRTGLRQADIRFLSMIKKMGILGNMLFVVNSDFSEHESLEDLQALIGKVREELALVRPDPDVYSFSALYNLFKALTGNLAKKDSLRLAQWEAEEDLVSFSEDERSRFESSLNTKLTQERFGLLLKNHLERMDVMVSGIDRWVRMNRELLEKDTRGGAATIKKMEYRQKRMDQIKSLIKNTLTGAKGDILRELKADIDRFFNPHTGSVLGQTSAFVNNYTVSVEKYREKLTTSGFSNTLYFVFQEFKQALDTFMAETINPEIASFTNSMETRIQSSLEGVAGPFHAVASDDIAELKAVISRPSKNNKLAEQEGRSLLDMEVLKRVAGLQLPSSTASLQYYTKVRAEAVMLLGLYSVKKFFKRALKKQPEKEQEEQLQALDNGIKLIKRETEKSITFHFENYRENFKFQYAAKLIEAASANLHQLLMEQFQSYNADIKAMEKVVEKKGKDREEMIDFLATITGETQGLEMSIEKAREKLL
jgi:GTPase SAR1 family protein